MASKTKRQKKKILGIDYGDRYIGCALSSEVGVLPIESVDRRKQDWKERIPLLVDDFGVELIIIGSVPGNDKMMKKIVNFKEEVEIATGLQVQLFDETRTSKWADDKMVDLGSKTSVRKRESHSIAAKRLVDNYLEKQTA